MLFGSLAKAGHPMGKFCWGKLANSTAGTHTAHKNLPGVHKCSVMTNRKTKRLHTPILLLLSVFHTNTIHRKAGAAILEKKNIYVCIYTHLTSIGNWQKRRKNEL